MRLRPTFAVCGAAVLACLATRTGALRLTAAIGFGPDPAHLMCPATGWAPVTLYLTGAASGGSAQVQLTETTEQRTFQCVRTVALHTGTVNEIVPMVVDVSEAYGSWYSMQRDISATVVQGGREVAHCTLSMPNEVDATTYTVLVLTRDGAGLQSLLPFQMGLVHRGVNPQTLQDRANAYGSAPRPSKANSVNTAASFAAAYPDPRMLPVSPQAYSGIDAIVIGDLPLEVLSPPQLSAIRGFVADGGLLVVSGGSNLATVRSPELADLIPVERPAVMSVASLPDLGSRYGQPFPAGPVALDTGALAPAAWTVWAPTSGQPLVTARPYGQGICVLTSFDALSGQFRTWPGAPLLWRDLFQLQSPDAALRNTFKASAVGSYFASATGNLGAALAGKQAVNAPLFGVVAAFLGLYVLLLVPVTYAVLKRLDRRELAWIVQPALVVVFTMASYGIAATMKSGALTVNRALVVEANAGTRIAAGYAMASLYSPHSTSYDIAFGTAAPGACDFAEVQPSEAFPIDQRSSSIVVSADRGATVHDIRVLQWANRAFASDCLVDLGGAVDASVTRMPGNRVRVHIRNGTHYVLDGASIVTNVASVQVGTLEPGAAADRTLAYAPATGVAAATAGLAGAGARDAAGDAPAGSRAAIQAAISFQPAGPSYGAYGTGTAQTYGRTPFALEAWVRAPLSQVSVNGAAPPGVECALLYVHLPNVARLTARQPTRCALVPSPFDQPAVTRLPLLSKRADGLLKP